ncbi:MAG: alternative ribosome rescue aminoacyl-tRNA hydrolase ArfB [Actinomycetota bacterium]|nr:alternative ribosome rescue aminoacyl-tRNA hydrolase ArfB [Actinomycetota bacterium]
MDGQPAGDAIVVRGSIAIPQSELQWRFSRSSGPGGQGVNTTDSRVQLSFDVTRTPSIPASLRERAVERLGPSLVDGSLVISASEHRSQWQNRKAAERRLAETLRAAIAPPPRARRATRPSRGAVERRLKAKRARSETKRLRRDRDAD